MGVIVQQELLDHVIPEDALSADIAALGGPYKVGKRLRPELDQKAARDWLLNCINPNHKQNLTLSQIYLIARWARDAGSTQFAVFWPSNLDMTKPVKIEPEDERARLQREFIAAVKTLDGIKQQLGKVS